MKSTWFAWMTLLSLAGCGRGLTQEEQDSENILQACYFMEGAAKVVGYWCYDSGFFPIPEGEDAIARVANASYWFYTTYTGDSTNEHPYSPTMDEFVRASVACNIPVPNGDWSAVCHDYATCWAEHGLILPEAWPVLTEPTVDTGICGTVSSLPGYDDD